MNTAIEFDGVLTLTKGFHIGEKPGRRARAVFTPPLT
jgi:hypothetical protein